jgi:hypothetical protein
VGGFFRQERVETGAQPTEFEVIARVVEVRQRHEAELLALDGVVRLAESQTVKAGPIDCEAGGRKCSIARAPRRLTVTSGRVTLSHVVEPAVGGVPRPWTDAIRERSEAPRPRSEHCPERAA